VHLPNLLLAALAAAAALLWCGLYLRTRRLAPLLLSHLILALVARGACGDAIYNMRIGAAALPMLPRQLAAADGDSLRVVPGAIEGFLDRCMTAGDVAVCVGWTADLDRRQCATELVTLADGRLRRYGAPGLPRPDVAAEFRMPAIAECGFRIAIPTAWLEMPGGVRFFATAEDGTSTELAYRWPARRGEGRPEG
jgi:hypothetical protein